MLDLLSTVPRGTVRVDRLVECAAMFRIRENALRVALARLRAEGRVECPERGRYRLGPGAAAVQREVSSWRDTEQGLERWAGGWIGVHSAGLPRSERARVRARRRALALLGFRRLAPGLEVRPANLRGGAAPLRNRLVTLGLEPEAPVLEITSLDAATDAHARTLWDGAALVRGYRAARQRLRESAERLRALPRAQACVESFLLGGEAIRRIVLDPKLPEELVPGDERRALIETMRAYDEIGRACWAGALVPERAAPARGPADLCGLDIAAAAR